MEAEDYKQAIFHPKMDKYHVLGTLKQEGDYNKIKKIYRQVSGHPFVKSITKGNVIAKNYNDIRKHKTLPFSGNLIGEISWNLIVFEDNKTLLVNFVELKDQYDKLFLLGKYNEAEIVLKEISKQTGKSIWLIENQLILEEYKTGVKANWNSLSELSKEITDPLVLFLLENLSKRAESKISYFRLRNIFQNQINEIGVNPYLLEYLCFKLNYLAYSGYENLSYMIYMENSSSIVDRYILLKEVLSEMLSIKFKEKKESLFFLTTKLSELFPHDKQLIQILTLFDPEYINRLDSNKSINKLIREYTEGNYEFCISNSPATIQNNPLVIEIYEIYVKSLIELKRPFEKTKVSEFIDFLMENLYSVYTNEITFEQSLDTSLKLSTAFSSTSWAKQLLSLIRSTSSSNIGNKQFTLQYIISSQIKNPRILHYVQKEKIENYKHQFNSEVELDKTIKLLSDISLGNSQSIIDDTTLQTNKKNIYIIRALIREKKFKEAQVYLEKLVLEPSYSIISKEEAIVNLFRCYLKLDLLKEGCCLFVKHFIENKQITKRLNKEKLLKKLDSTDLEVLNDLIELPIFYRLASLDSYLQYVSYDIYLENIKITRPSELIEKIKQYDSKLIFFLRDVCTIEIMHHSYHFNGTDDIENERLMILNKLIVEDKQNEDIYIKEITELNQNSNIRKAIREVNKGRISVNVQQLKQSETANIKEAFARFKEIETYSKVKDILGIDPTNMLNDLSVTALDELISNKVVYTNDPAFISFKVIFIELRDKYILSKEYGLDGYLSTRIRHGTLLNHIRSIFESQNIISQRGKDNNYLDNEFWNQSIPYNVHEKSNKIQSAIKTFSKSIDEYTESIIKDLIQVKTEKNIKKPNALFDYSLNNKDLAYLFTIAREAIKDHNTFIGFVFEFLESMTEKVLSQIRQRINNEIKSNYDKILQDFNTSIKEIVGTGNFPELISSINLCGTRLQNELKNISEWFYLASSSKDLILDLDVLIQTSIQITNTIYPNFNIKPNVIKKHSEPMYGTIHLIYVCRILLDNIIKHSELSSNDLNIEISFEIVNDEFLQIQFTNNFSNEIDKEVLAKKLNTIKQKWENSSDDFENVDIEGDSGYDKIRRIIVFDLECQKYFLNFDINNNNLEIKLSIEFLKLPKYAEENEDNIN